MRILRLLDPQVRTDVAARWPGNPYDWETAANELLETGFTPTARLDGGRYGLAIDGTWNNQPAVGKLDPDPQRAHAWHALTMLANAGIAPNVLASDPHAGWLIMERVRPGHNTRTLPADPDRLAVLLARIARLPQTPELPSLHDFLSPRLETPPVRDRSRSAAPVTPAERREALRLLAQMPRVSRVIHGDCSQGNLLHAPSRLVLVDPRGMAGDWHYDLAVATWKARLAEPEARRVVTAAGGNWDAVEAWQRIARASQV